MLKLSAVSLAVVLEHLAGAVAGVRMTVAVAAAAAAPAAALVMVVVIN